MSFNMPKCKFSPNSYLHLEFHPGIIRIYAYFFGQIVECPLLYFISILVIPTPKIPSIKYCWESFNCLDLLLFMICTKLPFGCFTYYFWMTIGVPTDAHSNSHFACLGARFTQPWLTGVPKLLCQ